MWVQTAWQFDTQMQSTSFERNDDVMNLGEISPHVVWQQYDVLHDLVSIDESMMPYYGSPSCKMFIKGKPIRFGYKLWCLCESDGYPYHLILYQGKDTTKNKEPLGLQVAGKIISAVEQYSEPTHHELFVDNFLPAMRGLM